MPLFDSDFLSKLEYLSLVSKRIFRDHLEAAALAVVSVAAPGNGPTHEFAQEALERITPLSP